MWRSQRAIGQRLSREIRETLDAHYPGPIACVVDWSIKKPPGSKPPEESSIVLSVSAIDVAAVSVRVVTHLDGSRPPTVTSLLSLDDKGCTSSRSQCLVLDAIILAATLSKALLGCGEDSGHYVEAQRLAESFELVASRPPKSPAAMEQDGMYIRTQSSLALATATCQRCNRRLPKWDWGMSMCDTCSASGPLTGSSDM